MCARPSTTFVALGLENWLDVTVYGLQCAAIGVWLHVYVADGGGLAAKIAPPVAFDGIYVAPLATIDVLAMDAGAQADVERFLLALNDVALALNIYRSIVSVCVLVMVLQARNRRRRRRQPSEEEEESRAAVGVSVSRRLFCCRRGFDFLPRSARAAVGPFVINRER